MKLLKALTAIAFAVALPCLAQAQTAPTLTYGQVLTPAQWTALFAGKQDWLGSPPILTGGGTMTGPLITAPSTPIQAGFNIPPGVAPTSPNNGDMWSTNGGFFGRANGVTYGPFAEGTAGGFTGTSPIVVTFPGAGVVNYAFNFSVANTFLAQQTDQGATTTQPGWYAQLTGDTNARVRVGLNSTDIPSLAFGPGNAVRDTFIERAAAAAFRLGSPDAAAPVAQTLGMQNVVAGTNNTAGANLIVNGSQGTGTGFGGNIVFQVAPAGSTGTAQNALATALTIFGSNGGVSTGAAIDEGAGTLNLVGSLYNNGTAPSGTGGYVRATGASLVTPALGVATATSEAIGGCTIGGNALCITGPFAFSAGGSFGGALTGITTLSMSGQLTSTVGSGTAPFVVTSPTVVANLNAALLNGATFAAPGAIGSTTPGSISATTLNASSQIIDTGTSAPSSAAGNSVHLGTLATAPTLSNTAQAFFYNMTVNGAVLQGDGSTYDAALLNKSGAVAMGVPTGTQNVAFGGGIVGASIATSGTIAGSVCRDASGNFIFANAANCEGAGAATTVTATNTAGATTVTGGNPGYALTQGASSSFMANNQLFSAAGGGISKFRNGGMMVWQRGTTGLAAAASLAKPCVATADGWCVAQTGAQATCSQGAGTNGALFSLGCIGVASNTDTQFTQRIESYDAAVLAGTIVTVQFQYKQTSGSTVTPKVSAGYASAADNFTTVTSDLAATSLTACATATWCTESYTFTVSVSASQGYQVTLDCNTALTAAQSCSITAADIRVTPGVTTGINANPPAPELRPIAEEISRNQRYYEVQNLPTGIINAAFVNATSNFIGAMSFLVAKRSTPTVGQSGTFAGVTAGGAVVNGTLSFSGTTTFNFSYNMAGVTGLVGGNGTALYANGACTITASAEL